MDKYDFDVYILPVESNINYFLLEHDNIRLIYEDELIEIYKNIE